MLLRAWVRHAAACSKLQRMMLSVTCPEALMRLSGMVLQANSRESMSWEETAHVVEETT